MTVDASRRRVRRSRRIVGRLILVVAFLGSVTPAPAARAEDGPLDLARLLASVEAHFPTLVAEREKVAGQRALSRAAEGGFDPVASVTASAAWAGYYDDRRVRAAVEQPTPLWGTVLTAGWRWSDGQVPPYYGEVETLARGEVFGGVRIPLWRDGAIDERRARIRTTSLAADASAASVSALRLRVAREAVNAYLAWVAAGLRLRLAEEMRTLAESRDTFVRSRVEAGAVPAIEVVENERAVLLRRAAVVRAQRAAEQASYRLALFVRDGRGNARAPSLAELPPDLPTLPDHEDHALARLVEGALERRPEREALRLELAAAGVELDLARNRVGPRLDVGLEASKDFAGDDLTARRTVLGPAVVQSSVLFSLPVPLRADRGRRDKAAADRRALAAQAQLLDDQIRFEVEDALSRLEASERGLTLAQDAARVSRQVADGERERFALGATTLLTVNLREEAVRDAETAWLDAKAEYIAALAHLRTARGEWPLERRGEGSP